MKCPECGKSTLPGVPFCRCGWPDRGDWYHPAPPAGSVEESVRDDARWERDDEPEDDDGA